ncbi:outer membrane lipoprotein-sorting protein [Corallincola luteus]|uniref:Outer membrane lipoprotein-sorting protein n=1 Tax=Corallincola luteus TaxID=1775177 RepID=A0ABY2ALI0_9GAMM|nr:outer membrane lipoprotein-sorting protein [Corallincola luteus]TCI03749.1 outer membrane lipoprotein-sorting protein [Corallincola luteus]
MPLKLIRLFLLSSVAVMQLFVVQAGAETPEQQGTRLAKERKAFDLGWIDTDADVEMRLTNAQGQSSSRKLRIKALEVTGDGDKSLMVFDFPNDIKGTAFLSFSHPIEADDQWIYLPALKRVKRIASKNKSGPFVGSEFAFEDLSSFEVEKYSYRYLGEELIDGVAHYKTEYIPKDKFSGYTRQLVWMDKEAYRVSKIDFYDRKNVLLKTLLLKDYRLYEAKHWRPLRMSMVNHQTGKGTEMLMSDYQFKTGISEEQFSKSKLKRAR